MSGGVTPWQPPSPGGPPGSPPAARRFDTFDRIGVVLAAVFLGLVGFYVLLLPFAQVPPLGCNCPAETPLGATVELGNPTGSCTPAPGPSASCSYAVPIYLTPAGVAAPPAKDLSFEVVQSNDAGVPDTFSTVALRMSSGCEVGVWYASNASWGASAGPRPCANATISAPLVNGEYFSLTPVPSNALSLSGRGEMLEVTAASSFYVGSITSPYL